ncbi:crown gall tumor protein VirC2 (plasmid) [Rhizobium etli 8C-3]|uniref:Crown gall tumor protein VirC2 n=1 Tax=Rhizobium etli 8C-3 TaxID=538025 RepID=A0A1L5PAK4_RHIET|nr:VirC2 family conjugal transfer protein [Rhizobium etli]APO77126.1 crown gall tumor protein VirC2 [Rhizobium etli 8C-3]
MAIRKPELTVAEARRLAAIRATATEKMTKSGGDGAADNSVTSFVVPPPSTKLKAAAGDEAAQAREPVAPQRLRQAEKTTPAPAPATRRKEVKKVQVFVSALVPAPKTSSVFDILIRQYSSQKALQMILRKALEDYEEMLSDGTFQKQPTNYQSSEAADALVLTSRMMPTSLLTIARAHFDPVGLESRRAFGFKLATAALASFFARERR